MADSKFRITVSAVDKATSVIRGIKSEFRDVTSPFREMQSSIASVGKELGFDKLGESLRDVGSVTTNVASEFAKMPALVGGGLSLAGLVEATSKWADMGSEIGKTSKISGVSSRELQELRGAARLVDVDASTMDGTIKSLGSTMENVFYHRAAPETIAAMNQMSISFRQTASGAPMVADGIASISDAVKKLDGNSEAQKKLLSLFNISEDALPLFNKGGKGIAKRREEYAKTGAVLSDDDIEGADHTKESFVKLSSAIGGVGMRAVSWWNRKFGIADFTNAAADWVGSIGADKPEQNPDSPQTTEKLKKNWSAPKKFFYENRSLFSGKSNVTETESEPETKPEVAANSAKDTALQPTSSTPAVRQPLFTRLPVPPTPAFLSNTTGSDGIQIDGPAPSPRAVEDLASSIVPKMSIEVLFKNAPAGAQMQVRDDNGNMVPARVQYGMPLSGP